MTSWPRSLLVLSGRGVVLWPSGPLASTLMYASSLPASSLRALCPSSLVHSVMFCMYDASLLDHSMYDGDGLFDTTPSHLPCRLL